MQQLAHTLERVEEPGLWYGADLAQTRWRVPFPEPVIEELRAASAGGAAPDAPLPATAAFADEVRRRLFHGCGVVVASGLPFEEWGEARSQRAIARVAAVMGDPVSQTLEGTTLYAVEDRGMTPRPGVRRSLTNVSQPYHSDGPWVRMPPWIVGLYAIRRARRGGVSRCISLKALFADLGEISPELRQRLECDFFWHRQSEHHADDTPVSRHPMLWHDDAGRWCGRFYADYVLSGYRAAGFPIDQTAVRALEELTRLAGEPFRRLEFTLSAGDVEWVNNRWCAHSRTGFEPSASAVQPRLVVRVWHREPGDPVGLDT